jgi:DNA-binding NarL/FixJ family response regulator
VRMLVIQEIHRGGTGVSDSRERGAPLWCRRAQWLPFKVDGCDSARESKMETSPKILVIDDELAFRTALADALLSQGYKMRSVTCRADAREAMIAEVPDLVILGTISPRGDAFALNQWMRTTIPFTVVPIIVIDCPLERQSVAGWRRYEGIRCDAEDYLVKPVDPTAMLPLIAKLVDRKTPRVKVLIVDDHALIRESIAALLSAQHDMQVVGVAENGRDALGKLVDLHPDVVVMDLRMPEMNGLEATREICRKPNHAQVLLVTQYDDEENVVASKKAGAWDLIPKKNASVELVSAIRAAGHTAQPRSEDLESRA